MTCLSAQMTNTLEGDLQSTVRPDCLWTVVAIAVPNVSTRLQSVGLNSSNLVEEDCFPKFFEELDNRSGILVLIKDPCTFPFVYYLPGSFLNTF